MYVPLRGGEGSEYRILHRGIKSGTPLQRVSQNEESGYSEVTMADGLRGYIQTQYLTTEPIARDLLDATRQQLLDAEAKYQKTLLRLQETEAERDEIAARLEQLILANDTLASEFEELRALSNNAVNIDAENRSLKDEQDSLLDEMEALIEANRILQNNDSQQWFLRGAGVVFLGLLFGFWIARRIYHRKNSTGWS